MPMNNSSWDRNDATAEVRRLHRRDSLSERIYLDLRGRLQRCAIGHDQRLVDLEVAAGYGTSRMPAREALLRLANEGYLVGTTRGFVTPKLSLDDIRDIFEIRHLLEPLAAANAARDMTAADQGLLAAAIEQARKAVAADDVERLILANINFRTAWLSAVRNERLANTIARFVDHVQTVRLSTLADRATRGVVCQGLEALNAAFHDRDTSAAATTMTNFLKAAERAFFAVRSHEIQALPGADQGLIRSRQAGLAGRS
jgi:DNA-binding GntR family transcriptional regulator